MARWFEPTEEQIASYREWVERRPAYTRPIAERLAPWELFRMKSTGHRVYVLALFEDGTVKVAVPGRFNLIEFERVVFGVEASDLEPCELPAPGEPLGARLDAQQVQDSLDAIRVRVRPDLWRMGEDGKAVWIGQGKAP